jgi:hypothetical protein
MKVRFYPDNDCSDVFEVPDNTTDEELSDMACDWVANHVGGFCVVVEDDE